MCVGAEHDADEPRGCVFCRGEEALGAYIIGRMPVTPGFCHVLRVDVAFGCAGVEMHTHDDWRIHFCPMCGRELGM